MTSWKSCTIVPARQTKAAEAENTLKQNDAVLKALDMLRK